MSITHFSDFPGWRVVAAPLLCLFVAACSGVERPPLVVDAGILVGTWQVDLRPKPDAPAYYQQLVVISVEGQALTGTFYNSTISQGRVNSDWDTLRIAFVTEDSSGPYHHSAILRGPKLEGLSNSTGRDFLRYWSAEKE